MASSALYLLSYLRIPVAATSAIVGGIGGLLYWKQNELIYPRSIPPDARTNVPSPTDFPSYSLTSWESLSLPTPDGETLHAFLLRPSNHALAKPITILTFHGNAGNIGHRIPIAGVLTNSLDVNVLMVEYRGYGKSTGDPDEKGLKIDAQTALDYMRERGDLRKTGFVVYGQSLGGAVSVDLVAKNQGQGDIRALILENTFLSIKKMIPNVLPAARYFAPLCTQVWASEDSIGAIKVPILFLSGSKDEIVPPSHMQQLYDLSTSPNKTLKLFPDGTHNDTVAAPGYFQATADFLSKHVMK